MASGSVLAYHGARGTTWRIVYRERPGGVQRMETATVGGVPARNEKEAKRALRERLVDIESGTYQAPTRLSFDAFAERFLVEYATPRVRRRTLIDYNGMLRNHLRPEFGDLALEDITPATIDQYIAHKRKTTQLSPKTLNNHLRLLHVMLGRAVKWRLLKVNPAAAIDKLKTEESEIDALEPAEVRAVIDQAPPIVALFVLGAVLTGARLNEVLSLTWDRIDLEKATVRLDRQWAPDGWAPLKSRKRSHALPAELWQALLDHHTTSPYDDPTDFVFASRTGGKIDGRNMLRWFKDAATKAGITRRVWIHQLRHTAGTRAAEMGLSALEVAAILGHAQASTSERYILPRREQRTSRPARPSDPRK